MFSSIAGRFGNGGQTDYSAANDLLCKSASHMRRDGHTRGIAIDWTAWAQIGMASRGSIPKMMEVAGIEMLPADVGVPVVRRELAAAGDGRRGAWSPVRSECSRPNAIRPAASTQSGRPRRAPSSRGR